ncbi:MAG: SDR family oxidoreductase, partial [bacterium]|nr:SDR family oxidoreductase [bacterium]
MQIPQIPLSANGKIDRKALSIIEFEGKEENEIIMAVTHEQKILAKTFENVLNIKGIGINQNIFELGADSLKVISVLTSIFKYKWDLSMQDFYKYPTIHQLSKKITEKEINDKIAAASEAQIEDRPEFIVNKYKRKKLTGSTLLTGSTGFLGSHILIELLENTNEKIYCLIRDSKDNRPKEKLKHILDFYFMDKLIDWKRVEVIEGDITDNYFGMTADKYMKLCKKISVVVHSAALVKHYGDYKKSEKVNVKGTNEIVNFAKESKSCLYHISTLSISGKYLVDFNSTNKIFTEKDFYIGQKLEDNVYVKSKYEAEKIVRKACAEGLNASILRLGNITARFSDGKKPIDVFGNFFETRFSIIFELGMVPDNILNVDVEFTPVDECAKCIVSLLKNNVQNNVLHLINNNYVKLGKIIDVVNSKKIFVRTTKLTEFMNEVEQKKGNSIYMFYLLGEKEFNIFDDFQSNIEIEAEYSLK